MSCILFRKNKIELPEFDNNIIINNKEVEIKDYTEDVLKKRIRYLNNEYRRKNKYNLKEKVFGLRYKMIKKEEIDNIFNKCCGFIEEEINKSIR